ncbi:MAG TPA: apolipoprotein N-acyltransferase [Planctomycetota bacterium]|nr:apolipoprotein N-acyltransferase [Planctomycetota bacterium]
MTGPGAGSPSKPGLRYGAAAASALLTAAAFPPIGWSALAWVSLAPWFAVLLRDRGEGHRGPAFLFGLLYFGTGLSWLGPLHLSFPVLLAAYLALFPLLFAVLLRQTAALGTAATALAIPCLWVGLDLLRERALTGFPWLQPGDALAGWPRMRQAADLGGAHLLTFAVVAPSALLGALWAGMERGRARFALVGVALGTPILLGVYGGWRQGTLVDRPGPRVLLVQPSFPQTIKAESAGSLPTAERMINEPLALSIAGVGEHPDTDVVVWAETMIPGVLREKERGRDMQDRETTLLLKRLADPVGVVPDGTRRFLAGAVVRGTDLKTRNSVLLVGPRGLIEGRCDKEHLTPFGEYVLGESLLSEGAAETVRGWVRRVSPFPLDMVSGASKPVVLKLPGGRPVRLGGLVCYEVIFPGLARDRVRDGADILVNLSNYAWYGAGMREQALDLARLRAVEARRPVIVCANDGPTAVIDGNGEIRARLRSGEKGTLFAEVPLDGRDSPHAAGGPVFALLAAAAGLGAALAGWAAGRRSRAAPPDPVPTRGNS